MPGSSRAWGPGQVEHRTRIPCQRRDEVIVGSLLLDKPVERVFKGGNAGRERERNHTQYSVLGQNELDDDKLRQGGVRDAREVDKIHQRRQVQPRDRKRRFSRRATW